MCLRLSLSNGAQATIVACSPQLSVGKGCKATLIGFDHGSPGSKTGNPITGGGGVILDLSNPKPPHTISVIALCAAIVALLLSLTMALQNTYARAS